MRFNSTSLRILSGRRSVVLFISLLLVAFLLPLQSKARADSRTFAETGKTLAGRFLEYWDAHGGLAQQGYPISDEMEEVSDTDGKTYMVQYFERALFELHSEFAGTPNEVLLSLLGVFLYNQKYPGGAPGQTPNNEAGSRLFDETGKSVGGLFLDYWDAHGGLAQQGLPISDEFQEKSDLDGKTYTVQYFERAVFELHPENAAPYNILLSQLGTFRYKAKYEQGGSGGQSGSTPEPNPTATTPAPRPTSTPTGPLPPVQSATFMYLSEITGDLSSPSGIAFDAKDNMFVVDSKNSRVQKFDKAGNPVMAFGSQGRGDGLFNFDEVGGVAVDKEGNVYVANSDNPSHGDPLSEPSIQVFDNNGNFLRKFGDTTVEGGRLLWPLDLAFDSKGNLYVLDDARNRVNKFDSNGNLVKWWQAPSTDNLAVDSEDNIYITTYNTNTVVKYDSEGNQLDSPIVATFSRPLGVTVDNQDNIYIIDGWLKEYPGVDSHPRVQKFDKYGRLLGSITGPPGSDEGEFLGPGYLALDSEGNLYVSDSYSNRVLKFSQK